MASALRHLRGIAAALAAAAALGGVVSAVTLQACTVTNDALDDAGPYEASTTDAGSTACGSCVELECAGPWAVCFNDEGCQRLRSCDNPFGESDGARQACFCDGASTDDSGTSARSLAAYVAFASCNDAKTCATSCASDCASSCTNMVSRTTSVSCATDDSGTDASIDAGDAGDGADAGVVAAEAPSVDGCASCVSGRCDSAKKLCAIGSECAAYLACAKGCSDAACVAACGVSRASGRASAIELSSCTLTSCRSACGL